MKKLPGLLLLVGLILLMAGCAQVRPLSPLPPLDSSAAANFSENYVPKVDNFHVILDASLSMTQSDAEFSQDEKKTTDFLVARDIVSRMNQGIPKNLDYNAALSSFGHNSVETRNLPELLYGMTEYNREGFHDALNKIKYVGGPTPMAEALRAAGNSLKEMPGKSALIVVSDGLHMDNSPETAQEIKKMMGDKLCIYTIAIGNDNNGAGKKVMQAIADAGGCGFATTDTALADNAGMMDFIKNVFLASPPPQKVKAAPEPPGDRDGDGVTDDIDKCPDTPRGEVVDKDGCTLKLTIRIHFDFDKAIIKPEFKDELAKAAAFMKKHADVPYFLLGGHTDHIGTIAYNQKLSEQRAAAVKEYLVQNYSIDPQRLYTKGYSKHRPLADNATEEGRYQNRRVEIICCFLKPPA